MRSQYARITRLVLAGTVCAAMTLFTLAGGAGAAAGAGNAGSGASVFQRASARTHVPAALLEALCYYEGRLSMNGGRPNIDHGYGCMDLLRNSRGNTLGQAARDLHVSDRALQTSLAANVLGGAAVLRDEARALSPGHRLPASLAGWYGAAAAYEHPVARSAGLMFANGIYAVLRTGFTGHTDQGQRVTLAGQRVTPDTASAAGVRGDISALPKVCKNDPSAVDYPGAVDCIVPKSYNCVTSPNPYPDCTYNGADRPGKLTINGIIIHDVEGSALDAINVFWTENSGVSVQYVVGSDGTVYQTLHEKDIPFGDGNYWSNQHTVQIENAGWDATGYNWYNAAEYQGSANLTAYLLKKYNLRLDRTDVLAHGTVPPINAGEQPVMHVDPGPYWLWDYYFRLIHQQGVPYPAPSGNSHVIALSPSTDQRPFGKNGTETPANFNFFYLYKGPSTASGLIPQMNSPTDVTDETNNVEPGMDYYYLNKVKDPAGTGDTMYEIWYGEVDRAHLSTPNYTEHAHLAWLAVPPGDHVVRGDDAAVTLHPPANGKNLWIFGDPIPQPLFHIGRAPSGSVFASGGTVMQGGVNWYVIDYNHRQAYVPPSEVTVMSPASH